MDEIENIFTRIMTTDSYPDIAQTTLQVLRESQRMIGSALDVFIEETKDIPGSVVVQFTNGHVGLLTDEEGYLLEFS